MRLKTSGLFVNFYSLTLLALEVRGVSKEDGWSISSGVKLKF
jgi:hypothetical protein